MKAIIDNKITLSDVPQNLMAEIKKEDLIETGDILQAEVIVRETNFNTCLDASEIPDGHKFFTEFINILMESKYPELAK